MQHIPLQPAPGGRLPDSPSWEPLAAQADSGHVCGCRSGGPCNCRGSGCHCGCHELGHHHPKTDAICLDRVSFAYGNGADQQVLAEVTLHVEQGSNLGIIGPNGAGKSTLLKILVGLLTGYRGEVRLFGMTPGQACRQGGLIGYVPQRHQVEWRFPLTARQVVAQGLVGKLGLLGRMKRQHHQQVQEMLDRVGAADLSTAHIAELSGGQQQRLFIARALVAHPRLLVLDEPMTGIDASGQKQIARLIAQLHREMNLTTLIVSHDIQALAAGCNHVACLRQTIHYHDTPSGLTPQVLAELFQHEAEGVFGPLRE